MGSSVHAGHFEPAGYRTTVSPGDRYPGADGALRLGSAVPRGSWPLMIISPCPLSHCKPLIRFRCSLLCFRAQRNFLAGPGPPLEGPHRIRPRRQRAADELNAHASSHLFRRFSRTPSFLIDIPAACAGAHRFQVAAESCGGCDVQKENGMGPAALPGCGVHDGVLYLPFLLPGAGLLRRHLPEESPDTTTPEGERKTPEQPGRTARSPGPSTGLRETGTSPNDGCRFPRPRSIGQYRNTPAGSENGAARGQENPGMGPPGAVSAPPGSHSHRLPAVRTGGTDRIHPVRGGNGSGSGRRRRVLPVDSGDAFAGGPGRRAGRGPVPFSG